MAVRYKKKARPPGRFHVMRKFHLTATTIKQWEQSGLVVPSRNKLGHRYYTPAQIARIKKLSAFLEQGYSIEEMRAALESN